MTYRVSRASSARMLRAAALVAALAWLGASAAQSAAPGAPLRALSSNGVRAGLDTVIPQCERSVGTTIETEFGTSASIRQRIGGGEVVDLAFITTPVVAELAKGCHLDSRSITPMGRAGIGFGIRAGGRKFEIGTADAIKQAFLAARSVTFAREGASRPHIERMFERLGIAVEMQVKTLLEPGSVQAAEKVVAGEAEVLLTLVSEIRPVDGMELIGPLPAEFQSYITFDAAIGSRATDAAAARAFVACVTSPAASPAFVAEGIER
jgi:molybdate transport system substrate-binding protein